MQGFTELFLTSIVTIGAQTVHYVNSIPGFSHHGDNRPVNGNNQHES